MASTYKTPGVYVEEISTLPASVAQVETAIPAFIGYTEMAILNGVEIPVNTPTRITSIKEYETLFGGPQKQVGITVDVITNDEGKETYVANQPTDPSIFLMYHSLQMYFNNGGGPCYIVSVGGYTAIDKAELQSGLDALAKEDEPTLILFPDGTNTSATNYYELNKQALAQCNKLQDRFTIMDVHGGDTNKMALEVEALRDGVGMDYLKYGASYYPFLKTTFNYPYDDDTVTIIDSESAVPVVTYKLTTIALEASSLTSNQKSLVTAADPSFIGEVFNDVTAFTTALTSIFPTPLSQAKLDELITAAELSEGSNTDQFLSEIKETQNGKYNAIKAEISKLTITMPPSSAIAGVYARVDSDRGVWKAPANVSLNSVKEPLVKVTAEEQGDLNIDATSGKSVNVIRTFTGKGVLVWGARTLAGNDNEWRYVPVRRFFNMVEESVKKASEFVVFEPNDANTWIRVKGMIENYLTGLWRAGALAGAKPSDAFFVNVGVGTTMTPQDILEGKMIIEIGMAAVRPAEFIILKFSHKLQE